MSTKIYGNDSTPMDPKLEQAFNVIESTYGVTVSARAKRKNLLKFGESQQVGTSKTTLMDLPTGTLLESYIATNGIAYVSSSSGSDTTELKIEGHTVDGSGNFTFVVQTVTLVGQTKTALTTPLARCTRLVNNGATDFVGNIYVYEDDTVVAGVPQTGAKVHCMITAGKNNSSKCATTLSENDYWIVTKFTTNIMEKAAAFGEAHLEVREKGKVFVEKAHLSVTEDSGIGVYNFDPYLIVPANADVRVVALADGANTYIGGTIDGILAIIES